MRLVHPSDEDGFAQVLTEAMSVGCPVVTADAQGGGPRFVTDDGQYGLLVPRGDRDELAAAMTSMLQDDLRAHYAELGLRRVEAMSPLASATALFDFIETLAAGEPSRQAPARPGHARCLAGQRAGHTPR